jgi:TM2 domain-containing membrane protein YozV
MKMIISAVASLLIPGLGQLFHGKFMWALGWFAAYLVFGFVVALMSAAHALFLSIK